MMWLHTLFLCGLISVAAGLAWLAWMFDRD
jgi:hypothetical protein